LPNAGLWPLPDNGVLGPWLQWKEKMSGSRVAPRAASNLPKRDKIQVRQYCRSAEDGQGIPTCLAENTPLAQVCRQDEIVIAAYFSMRLAGHCQKNHLGFVFVDCEWPGHQQDLERLPVRWENGVIEHMEAVIPELSGKLHRKRLYLSGLQRVTNIITNDNNLSPARLNNLFVNLPTWFFRTGAMDLIQCESEKAWHIR
jgi:hypothetical protein